MSTNCLLFKPGNFTVFTQETLFEDIVYVYRPPFGWWRACPEVAVTAEPAFNYPRITYLGVITPGAINVNVLCYILFICWGWWTAWHRYIGSPLFSCNEGVIGNLTTKQGELILHWSNYPGLACYNAEMLLWSYTLYHRNCRLFQNVELTPEGYISCYGREGAVYLIQNESKPTR